MLGLTHVQDEAFRILWYLQRWFASYLIDKPECGCKGYSYYKDSLISLLIPLLSRCSRMISLHILKVSSYV